MNGLYTIEIKEYKDLLEARICDIFYNDFYWSTRPFIRQLSSEMFKDFLDSKYKVVILNPPEWVLYATSDG